MREGMIILILVPTTVYAVCLVAQSCPTLCDPMDCSPPGSSVRGDSPGKNTGVGCRALLPPADLPHPGIEPRSPTLQADFFFFTPSKHQGIPRILKWVAYPFSRGCFPPRNRTEVSCIAGGVFTA